MLCFVIFYIGVYCIKILVFKYATITDMQHITDIIIKSDQKENCYIKIYITQSSISDHSFYFVYLVRSVLHGPRLVAHAELSIQKPSNILNIEYTIITWCTINRICGLNGQSRKNGVTRNMLKYKNCYTS